MVEPDYRWLYVFVAVAVRKGKVHWSWIDSMKTEMVGATVNGLNQQTEVAVVVWDGAPSHRDQRLHGLGLALIGLPRTAQISIRRSGYLRRCGQWIDGKVYGSVEDKAEAVDAFLTRFESDPNRVRALTGWDWIEEAVHGLPLRLAA